MAKGIAWTWFLTGVFLASLYGAIFVIQTVAHWQY